MIYDSNEVRKLGHTAQDTQSRRITQRIHATDPLPFVSFSIVE